MITYLKTKPKPAKSTVLINSESEINGPVHMEVNNPSGCNLLNLFKILHAGMIVFVLPSDGLVYQ